MPAKLHAEGEMSDARLLDMIFPLHVWNQCRQADHPISDAWQIQKLQSCQQPSAFTLVSHILQGNIHQLCHIEFNTGMKNVSLVYNIYMTFMDTKHVTLPTTHIYFPFWLSSLSSCLFTTFMLISLQQTNRVRLMKKGKVHSGSRSHATSKQDKCIFCQCLCWAAKIFQDGVVHLVAQAELYILTVWKGLCVSVTSKEELLCTS